MNLTAEELQEIIAGAAALAVAQAMKEARESQEKLVAQNNALMKAVEEQRAQNEELKKSHEEQKVQNAKHQEEIAKLQESHGKLEKRASEVDKQQDALRKFTGCTQGDAVENYQTNIKLLNEIGQLQNDKANSSDFETVVRRKYEYLNAKLLTKAQEQIKKNPNNDNTEFAASLVGNSAIAAGTAASMASGAVGTTAIASTLGIAAGTAATVATAGLGVVVVGTVVMTGVLLHKMKQSKDEAILMDNVAALGEICKKFDERDAAIASKQQEADKLVALNEKIKQHDPKFDSRSFEEERKKIDGQIQNYPNMTPDQKAQHQREMLSQLHAGDLRDEIKAQLPKTLEELSKLTISDRALEATTKLGTERIKAKQEKRFGLSAYNDVDDIQKRRKQEVHAEMDQISTNSESVNFNSYPIKRGTINPNLSIAASIKKIREELKEAGIGITEERKKEIIQTKNIWVKDEHGQYKKQARSAGR